MNIRYRVELSEAERVELEALLRGGRHAARKLKRAQILLAADAGVPDETMAQSLGVGGSTVYRTKRRFVEGNLKRTLSEEPRPGAKRKLTGPEEALHIVSRQGLSSFSARRRRTVSRETLSCAVRRTISPASSSRVQRARPSGGRAQAVATRSASSGPVSLRFAPGRGSSERALLRLPSTKRRLVR